jgi:hypothetical protein
MWCYALGDGDFSQRDRYFWPLPIGIQARRSSTREDLGELRAEFAV